MKSIIVSVTEAAILIFAAGLPARADLCNFDNNTSACAVLKEDSYYLLNGTSQTSLYFVVDDYLTELATIDYWQAYITNEGSLTSVTFGQLCTTTGCADSTSTNNPGYLNRWTTNFFQVIAGGSTSNQWTPAEDYLGVLRLTYSNWYQPTVSNAYFTSFGYGDIKHGFESTIKYEQPYYYPPEIDSGSAASALAFISGVMVIIRGRRK